MVGGSCWTGGYPALPADSRAVLQRAVDVVGAIALQRFVTDRLVTEHTDRCCGDDT